MKKVLLYFIFLAVFTASTNAQYWYNKYYSDRNLSELNSDELFNLLEKADKTAKNGTILTITGSAAWLMGGASLMGKATTDLLTWDYSGSEGYAMLTLVTITGGVVAIIGIVTLITGKNRQKMIRKSIDFLGQDAQLEMKPSLYYNNITRSYSSGFTITVNF